VIRIHKNGQEWEPVSPEEIQQQVESGELTANDWVWDDQTETWAPLCELFPQWFPSSSLSTCGEYSFESTGMASETVATTETTEPVETTQLPEPALDEKLFLGDGQKKKMVRMILETMQQAAEPDEELLYIATQRKPIPDLTPEALALTNQRIFIFEKGHFKSQYDDFLLKSVLTPKIKTGLFFSHITFSAGAGEVHGVRFLPKIQGKKCFQLFESRIHEIRASRKTGKQTTPQPTTPTPVEAAKSPPGIPPELQEHEQAILHRLETLKQMLEEDLITQDDFEVKKKNLIAQL